MLFISPVIIFDKGLFKYLTPGEDGEGVSQKCEENGVGVVVSYKKYITPFSLLQCIWNRLKTNILETLQANFHFSSLLHSMLPFAYKYALDVHLSVQIITNP